MTDSIWLPSLSTSLDPLPPELRRGLPFVAGFGLLSFFTSVGLFGLLTYRLISWYRRGQLRQGANQFLILIYNLVIADIQQSIAFASTTYYLAQDKLEVGTTTCYANGWFVSVGDLASSVFIFAIALHTFFAIVKGRKMSDRSFYLSLLCAWCFVYIMAIITVSIHKDIYVRAGAWCWIDTQYAKERLWLHYIWIFVCMFGTVVVYMLIYVSIYTMARLDLNSDESRRGEVAATKRAAKYMIIYPVVYVVCTLPLAGGRMAAIGGIRIPYWYYCISGAAITSCGWLDVILYALTRRVLVFSKSPPPPTDFGVHTFGWHTGSNFWGTTTTIEGPLTQSNRNFTKRSYTGNGSIRAMRPLRSRSSEEDCFAAPVGGVITAKTTVEVHSGPILNYAMSDSSIIMELEDKPVLKEATIPR